MTGWVILPQPTLRQAVVWLSHAVEHALEVNQHLGPERCLAVFDIDGTILTRHGTPQGEQTFFFADVQELARFCFRRKVPIAIVTARAHSIPNRNYTHEQLLQWGVAYNFLYMRLPSYSTRWMKDACRKHLESTTKGKIIVLLGDNWPDISATDPPVPFLIENHPASQPQYYTGFSPEGVPFLKLPTER